MQQHSRTLPAQSICTTLHSQLHGRATFPSTLSLPSPGMPCSSWGPLESISYQPLYTTADVGIRVIPKLLAMKQGIRSMRMGSGIGLSWKLKISWFGKQAQHFRFSAACSPATLQSGGRPQEHYSIDSFQGHSSEVHPGSA